jgi:hypothetical protein
MKTAYATLNGFEVMRAPKRGQGRPFHNGDGLMGGIRLIVRKLGSAACNSDHMAIILGFAGVCDGTKDP